ncbi:erythromycin esterase family protein [Cohnella caldifontis]|uniref:erythromycin esterase family protein n=1 Tax=Cohnella caldifontis TaxID=3027471 RepID=UPI0023ED0D94|nr:erythromycin esterase family protein [Cohnella sp. YIM B05605]
MFSRDTEKWIREIRDLSIPLNRSDDLDVIVEAAADARVVLLGEASHGTSEYYTIRMEITKRLIRDKGFHFVAVEGDWPSCGTLNRFVKNAPGAAENVLEALGDFNRWPTWMWANREVAELAGWLRKHNSGLAGAERKVGFYGLDVYSLWESMEEVIRHLEQTGAEELKIAKEAFACFDPFSRDPQTYGVSAAFFSDSCEEEVVKLLSELRANRKRAGENEEAELHDEVNALVAVNAERYYRAMVRGGPESWNIRDEHMVEALNLVRAFYGSEAKAVVWEHNTHIGDARATDMAEDGMVNVGQLMREQLGREHVFAVGFGSHRGTVIAAREWGGAIERMDVPPAIPGSWEDLMHRAGEGDKILMLREHGDRFAETVGHRAIGVVYHPRRERGNYVPSRMSERYDAFVYVDTSKALDPLQVEVVHV